MSDISLVPATSTELIASCIAIRKTVFVQDQGYIHLDEDNRPEDAAALHFLLASSSQDPDASARFMGTVRLAALPLPVSPTLNPDPNTKTYILSRFALLPPFRRGGNGAKFLGLLEHWVLQHTSQDELGSRVVAVELEAQEGSYGFYERLGYVRQSGEYVKDGKPHVRMRKELVME
ncbi:acyl-CoA N-acyltransferase [Mycena maculata]|uniref:Acyl-CoA N-acyltransferase n=1 Tax=Mycena maculata TaxID=230809 RepID=A0AAD7NJN5_9AGAR|nr:acyl-CoA N-acyltransferase [Mycena maculata]